MRVIICVFGNHRVVLPQIPTILPSIREQPPKDGLFWFRGRKMNLRAQKAQEALLAAFPIGLAVCIKGAGKITTITREALI